MCFLLIGRSRVRWFVFLISPYFCRLGRTVSEPGEVVGCLRDGVRWGSGLCIYIAQSHLWEDIFSPLLCTVTFVTSQYMSVSAHLRSLPLAYWTVIVRTAPVSFLVSLRWMLTSSRVISSSRLLWATSVLLALLSSFRVSLSVSTEHC